MDHPRSRGVYLSARLQGLAHVGSSPLARGLRVIGVALRDATRIIPARAGFTQPSRSQAEPHADHPRSRGVYRVGKRWETIGYGSSPLARGLPPGDWVGTSCPRIIPARAGFTALASHTRCSFGDHPRSRGVYISPGILRSSASGSSPLARGLLVDEDRLPLTGWIIPARAGFTFS